MMSEEQDTARGVDALIARLRDDGVAAGAAEADRLTTEAKAQAARIVSDAEATAEKMKADAQNAVDRYQRAGEEALNTAMRDAVLTMRSTLMAKFEQDVQRMVTEHLAEPEMLKQMVLEVVGRAGEAADVERTAVGDTGRC